ncbi:MAG: ABC transporter substrate-binding protein [Pseudomonadota bacterium]
MMRTLLRSAVLATALATTPAAIAQTPDDALVMAWRFDDIISLDPAEMYEISTFEVAANTYDTLVSYDLDDTSVIRPRLAESWTVSEDGRTFTFTLREGVTFHSGNPLTAEDVVYSFARLAAMDKGPAFLIHDLGITPDNHAEVLAAPDARTFTMTLDQAYAPSFVLNVIGGKNFSIVDSRLLQENEVEGDWGNDWLKTRAAGTGPYRLDQMVPNERILASRFDAHWAGPAELARLMWRYVPEPATQRLLVEEGDVDVARNLTADQIDPLRAAGTLQIVSRALGTQLYMGLNVAKPPLDDVRVRQALKHLVDYDGMARTFMRDAWTVNQTFLPAGMLGFVDSRPFALDIEKAKALLADAGYADGFDLSVHVSTHQERMDTAQAIQATFAEAGIELEILSSDARTALTAYRAREHDIYLGTWGIDYFDPATNAVFVANADNSDDAAAKPLAWRNSWQDEDLTERVQALTLEADEATRAAGYQDLIRDWQEVSPFVMLFQSTDIAAVRPNVEGFRLAPTADGNRFSSVTKN